MNQLAQIFLTFLRIGAFTFGGGYAMIPLIEKETVENRQWISRSDLLDVVAIAESTPGPIAVNAATFIGKKVAGIRGAVCATLGVVLPSFLIIVIISLVLDAFSHLKAVQYAFWGIRAGVLALIAKALWTMFTQVRKDIFSCLVMVLAFVCVACFQISTIAVIAFCALLGIACGAALHRKKDQR